MRRLSLLRLRYRLRTLTTRPPPLPRVGVDRSHNTPEVSCWSQSAAFTIGQLLIFFACPLFLTSLFGRFVLLLDFMSLYPSIIREFNLCFTTTQVSISSCLSLLTALAQHWTADEICALPSPDAKPGRLPAVLSSLIERRARVKQLMKSERDEQLLQQYDIRQRALKLIANSMYGCLGFDNSRFVCKPLAALITQQGREILTQTVQIVESQLGLSVVYGDTDSIFIATDLLAPVDPKAVSQDVKGLYDQAMQMGQKIVSEINRRHRVLEIEVDAVLCSLLLLRKKKYAALSLELDGGSVKIERQVKGLDMVRRDWCELSKRCGQRVLDHLLSGQSREEIITQVHASLAQLRKELDDTPISDFVINKELTKSPSDYPDAKSQPHVQVALELMQMGRTVRVGDIIPYVICKGDDSANQPIGQRAHHPDVVAQSQQKTEDPSAKVFEIDIDWYLQQQVLPPTSRLLSVFDETNPAQLAHHLGMKLSASQASQLSNQYKGEQRDNAEDDEAQWDVQLSDVTERYSRCSPIEVIWFDVLCFSSRFPPLPSPPPSLFASFAHTCSINSPYCKVSQPLSFPFDARRLSSSSVDLSGFNCVTPQCPGLIPSRSFSQDDTPVESNENTPTYPLASDSDLHSIALFSNRLLSAVQLQLRQLQRQYAVSASRCSDPICGRISRDLNLSHQSRRCLNRHCRGMMIPFHSDTMLHDHMRYYAALFDIERARAMAVAESRKRSQTLPLHLPESHSVVYERLFRFMDTQLKHSEYYNVSCDNVFAVCLSRQDRLNRRLSRLSVGF